MCLNVTRIVPVPVPLPVPVAVAVANKQIDLFPVAIVCVVAAA